MEFKKENYKIAIPSYKRAETLKKCTLEMLRYNNINPKRIFVFVGDESQKIEYEKVLDKGTYGEIVVGVVGMMDIRNFITDYFEKGEYIFNLDDDIRYFKGLLAERRSLGDVEYESLKKVMAAGKGKGICVGKHYIYETRIKNLEWYILEGFKIIENNGTNFFGFYTSDNPMGMSRTISHGLYYVIGSNWGTINTKEVYVTIDDKEDYERTLKFFQRDGKIIRINCIGPCTNYYTEPGGMQEERTMQRVELSAKFLGSKYPDLCTAYIKETSKGNFWEIKFNQSLNKLFPNEKF